jgi:predicted O-linked N-acetylglucosamine transferase (SPINDLY family)
LANSSELISTGLNHFQSGRFLEAEQVFLQALKSNPKDFTVLKCLGQVLAANGKIPEATESFAKAHRLNETDWETIVHLAASLRIQNRLDEAISNYKRAMKLQPDFAQVYLNLGDALRSKGQMDEALSVYQQALQKWPFLAWAHYGMAKVFEAQRKLNETIACYKRAVQAWPFFAEAHREAGHVFRGMGQLQPALLAYRQALQCNPNDPDTHTQLGSIAIHLSQFNDALAHFQSALKANPNHAEAHHGLGMAYTFQGKVDEAEESFRKACELSPNFALPRYNLGLALQSQGNLAEARECLRQAVRLQPNDPVAHGALLSSMNCDPEVDSATLFAEHRRWAERLAPPSSVWPNHENSPDPNRVLRVGYLSPDFRLHAVAYFMEPILTNHNRRQVESYCYADVAAPDTMTQHLQSKAHQWRQTVNMPHEVLFNGIRQDKIDVLVDLAGHMGNNRLQIFARKPAPIQVSYLGYPATTGLSAIDYRIVDAVTDPPGEPSCHTEELVRIPDVFCCYLGPPHLPLETWPPSQRSKAVTFGSLHKLEKLNDQVVELWCQILKDLPSARLLLGRDTLQGKTNERLLARFRQRGIAPSRILLRQANSFSFQHMQLYDEMDVSLDTFPWSGHTTACESLWMGVPVVTLRGKRFAGRMVASVLTSLGLPDLIAETPEEYRRLAVKLANDLPRLANFRGRLRSTMVQSPLCDGVGFVKKIEDAYRWMWRRWCQKKATPQPAPVSRAGGFWDTFGSSE